MKTKKLILAVMFAVTTYAAATTPTTQPTGGNYVPGELIVKFENGIIDLPGFEETPITSVTILDSQFVQPIQELNVKSVEHVFKGIFARPPFTFITKSGHEVQLEDLSQVYLLRMDETLNMKQVADSLRQLPGVIYAEPNNVLEACIVFPNDSDFLYEGVEYKPYQWGLYDRYLVSGHYGWDVDAVKAWSVETGDRSILLAILDSGLENAHYDESNDEFYGRVTNTHNFTPDGTMQDFTGHGTHVTGIAAAATNTAAGQGGYNGIAGVAGGWSQQKGVNLAIAKISESGGTTAARMASAIEWGVSLGAPALNCSYGGGLFSSTVKDAAENALKADMTICFSSGNSPPAPRVDVVEFPANLAGWNLLCAVGAIIPSGVRAGFSCYGNPLTFVAPGVDIWSTSYNSEDYWAYKNGTSMASPHAAGVGALLYSSNPDLMDVDCKRIMEKTARDIQYSIGGEVAGEGWDQYTGYGCVDAWEALRQLYWPYTLEHKTAAHSQLQKTSLGTGWVTFLDDQSDLLLPAGQYSCKKFRFSGSVSFSSGFEETPWFWERILSEPIGYKATGDGSITEGKYGLDVTNLTSTGASFQTYTYYVIANKVGQAINKWVPYDTADIAVAVTALGRSATSMTYLPRTPSPTSAYGLFSDLVVDWYHADAPNTIHISYYEMGSKDLRYIVDDLSGNPNDEIVAFNGDVGRYSSIALDYEGYPHIVYLDQTNCIPKHAYKNSSGNWVNEIMWDRLGTATVYYTSIAIGEYPAFSPAGQIHACGYLGSTSPMPPGFDGQDLVYMTRDGSLPYGWRIEPVDVTGNVGAFCSIASYNNVPYISYFDVDNTSLKCAVKNGTWTTYTVDNSGNVGWYTSIAIDLLGGVHISYYDATNDELKYAYKAEGSGTWSTETVDQYGVQGTSICIDDDGRPVIVYGGGAGSEIYSAKKLSGGWSVQPVASGGDAWYGISAGIDNLGRMATCYYNDSDQKLYMTRRIRWPQESGYGLMLAGQSAEVKEQTSLLQPTLCLAMSSPMCGSATIKYSLPYASNVRIAIFDVTGRLVANLLDGEQNTGEHEMVWDGFDYAGNQVATGVYFIRLSTPENQVSTKFTRIR